MLKDENLQSKLDKNHVLLLFKINEFTQGVTEVCELLGLKTELLNYYIEKRDLKEILRFCKKNGYDDPNLWITALNFFCSKGSVDETNYTEKLGMIPEILENIVDIENLSHILVLKIMMNNDQIQAKHVKKYFIKKIRNQRSQIQQVIVSKTRKSKSFRRTWNRLKMLKRSTRN